MGAHTLGPRPQGGLLRDLVTRANEISEHGHINSVQSSSKTPPAGGNAPHFAKPRFPGELDNEFIEWAAINAVSQFLRI